MRLEKKLNVNIFEMNTDDECYWIENVEKLWKDLNKMKSQRTFINTEQTNEII